MDDAAVLEEQVRYYRARAPEYDKWFNRIGRYDLGPEGNKRWFAGTAEVEAALEEFAPRGDVLELAAGTGLWTQHLVRFASRLTAVDAAPETLALNRERVAGGAAVEYVVADLFSWRPQRRYDVCFFGFWHSHVPESRFEAFWQLVAETLRPSGRVFLVDSGRSETTHSRPVDDPERVIRRLEDGREFEIVKRYDAPEELGARLGELGWRFDLRLTRSDSLLYGSGARA